MGRSVSIADESQENPRGRGCRLPMDRIAGLKLPTEAFEDLAEKDTFNTCRDTQSRGPTKVQVARKSGQEKLTHSPRPY